MSVTWIDADELDLLLPPRAAVDALDRAFATLEDWASPPRTSTSGAAGELLVMPAAGPPGAGAKLVTVAPGNPARGLPLIHGLYVLFDADRLAPAAVLDGAALTARRTAAVSALATRYLARQDAEVLVIFGAGVQAHAHAMAIPAVRPVTEVIVVAPDDPAACRLVEDLTAHRMTARRGSVDDVAAADIVCTCTTSPVPVFDGNALRAGAHVNAIGAYTPGTREVDSTLVSRSRVVVEHRDVALAGAGDLLLAERDGAFTADRIVADMGEVCGGVRVRRDDDDITLFKSVGMAMEDLALAAAAVTARDEAALRPR